MGNEAIAMGAIAAGVGLVCGYPGTPSTEVLETVAKHRPEDCYVEWSINEKTAMEVAAGAAYAGARVLVTMKQMGLNVASDPLMCVEYVGVKGGMVVLVADDPGPISSQTEQDTRTFARFSKVPCFDPSTAQEAYDMVQEAFELSEKYGTPVFVRPTTRVSHGYADIVVKDPEEYEKHEAEGFIKDTKKWVIFPRASFLNHQRIEKRNKELTAELSESRFNRIEPETESTVGCGFGIACSGISYTYAMEARRELGDVKLLKVGTPFPFPEELALDFLDGLDRVLCIEELDPVIERELTYLCGKHTMNVWIRGKLDGFLPNAGENTVDSVKQATAKFLYTDLKTPEAPELPPLPVRPPVLCAGCPHRASFYAVKKAMAGQKTLYCGDIGCYTLGNAMPLDMVDTCLCMGAGLGIAQGVFHTEPDTNCFAFVGDSTFFASAIPSVINGLFNQADFTLVVLDNSTTAMTGHQPHPGTGRTMMGETVPAVSIEGVLKGVGLTCVETVDPFDHEAAVACVKRVAAEKGVKAIIFRSPCIAISKPSGKCAVDADACIGCRTCIDEIGCPALSFADGRAVIDEAQCTGCGLCSQICPVGAIAPAGKEARHE